MIHWCLSLPSKQKKLGEHSKFSLKQIVFNLTTFFSIYPVCEFLKKYELNLPKGFVTRGSAESSFYWLLQQSLFSVRCRMNIEVCIKKYQQRRYFWLTSYKRVMRLGWHNNAKDGKYFLTSDYNPLDCQNYICKL